MAYDPVRGVTVLYGGDSGSTLDPWEWNGDRWTPRSRLGPSTTRTPAMAFRASQGAIMAVGPEQGSFSPNLTWVWDGTTWERLLQPTPNPSICMVDDPVRDRLVLIRPSSGQHWEWDGVLWRLIGPALVRTVFVFDEARSVVVSASTDGTFEYDGAAWVQRTSETPWTGGSPAGAYDITRGVTVAFSGLECCIGETWEWDGSSWAYAANSGPPARVGHRMVHDSGRAVTVLFGGLITSGLLSDTWEYGLYPDCDVSTGIGSLDVFDFLCFLNRFETRDRYACDCDLGTGPATCDIFDFLCFQDAFTACR